MAKVAALVPVLLLLAVLKTEAMLHEPFPTGNAMSSLGTIAGENSPGGRNPFTSAAFMGSRSKAGLSASVTTFYDDMDNYTDRRLVNMAAGGYCAIQWFQCKIAVSHFDALGAYYEQSGYFSCAASLRGMRLGVDICGTRTYINARGYYPITLGEAGISLFIPVSPIFFTASVQHLPVKTTNRDGADPPAVLQLGVHTSQHTFGAQGMLINITPQQEHPVNMAIGQEVRLHRNIALCGAIANNPFLISFGISVTMGGCNASASMVDHPVLGWSRGFSAEYGWLGSGSAESIMHEK